MSLVSFSGLASGIDSASLIEAIIERQRSARVVPLEAKVATLTDTNSAFGELTSLLNTLKDKASVFRTINGGPLAKSAVSSNDSVLTAVASNGATSGTYEITVNALASNSISSFNNTYSSGDELVNGALGATTTVQFDIGEGSSLESVSISVDNSTTVNDFVNEFNEQSDNAIASLVNTGTSSSPAYKIVITSTETGEETGFISITDGGVFSGNTIDQATDLSFDVSGIGTITRSSNTVDDVLDGVSLTFADTGSSTVTVQTDNSATISKIQEFVDAYNEVISYISENDLITSSEEDGETVITYGTLSGTSLDESIVSALRSALSGASISGSVANTLSDLGVTTARDGTLEFDSSVATDALQNDPEGVEEILTNLGEDLAATSGTIDQFTRYNGLIDISEQSNQELISDYNDRIASIEKSLAAQEAALVSQFARLEALIGQLNSQQSALLSLLPSS